MSQPQHLVWDWNGTLLDDLSLVIDATNITLSSVGGPVVTVDEHRRDFRRPIIEYYSQVLGRPLDVTEFAALDKVFHDAYQYFERRFGLEVAGSITVTPDSQPSAQRVAELRDKLQSAGADCVFAEPQFEPAIVETIIAGTDARAGTLDPEGAGLSEGPGLYRELVQSLADSIEACLTGAAP